MLSEVLLFAYSRAQAPVGLAILFLLWRLWSFSLRDWFQPSKPKELPYLIPFLGHAYSFFWNFVELMESSINYTGRTHEPVAVTLGGEKMYIVTQPEDVNDVFNNQHGLDNDYSLRETLFAFGVAPEDQVRAWHCPQPGDRCYIQDNPLNPQQMCFIKWVQHSYRKQLLTPRLVERMCQLVVGSLSDSIRPDSIAYCLMGEDNTYSLYQLTRSAMVEAATQSMFGPCLHELDPNIVEQMLGFNDHAWQVVMKYPDFGFSAVSKPRKTMMSILRRFIERSAAQNQQASTFIQDILVAMENTQLGMHSRAAMLLMIFWASVSNGYNSLFWLLSHLLYDPSLLKEVQREIEGAWHPQSGKLDTKYLIEHCPVLDASFNEVLRHKNAAAAMRMVVKDTTIGSKLFRAGNMAYIPFKQLHTNEDVWGERCTEFDHTRFLKQKSLSRSSSFRPFGGGATYCPGKSFAKQEVYSAVAILLHRFHVRLPTVNGKKQPFPVQNLKTPSLGLNGPVEGMDLLVVMTERKEESQ